MKFTLVALLVLVAYAQARILEEQPLTSVYNYLEKSVAFANERFAFEAKFIQQQRVVGGVDAALGQIPWQAGLLIEIPGVGTGVCGASLVSATRLITAAHCWFDGVNQAASFTVRMGTVLLTGTQGVTQITTTVRVHPRWTPAIVQNDVAVVVLPSSVTFTQNLSPITLPTGTELSESFAGHSATVSGFGVTTPGGGVSTILQMNTLNVITNSLCATSFSFPSIIHATHICTSGVGTVGACNGDSGGPLVVESSGRNILIGVVSFVPIEGCHAGLPTVYTRVTSFADWFQSQM